MEEQKELLSIDKIRNKVYTIRGQQVMLDADLAEIYGYEVKRLNEQVKRNISRFPEDFMFQLFKEEIPADFLKSQFATLKASEDKRGMHIKKLPYAFTEQGIYMLATVLRGELAEQQSNTPDNRYFASGRGQNCKLKQGAIHSDNAHNLCHNLNFYSTATALTRQVQCCHTVLSLSTLPGRTSRLEYLQ